MRHAHFAKLIWVLEVVVAAFGFDKDPSIGLYFVYNFL